MQNLGLKVLALAIAILLALFVHGEGNSSQVKLLVPIELRSIPNDRVVVSTSRSQAEITVRGPAFLVSRIAMNPPVINANIPDATPDQFNLQLGKQQIELPWGIRLVSVEPQEVSFKMESLISKVVPVVVPRFGLIPRTHELSKIEVIPSEIEARGPRSLVESLSRIETEPLELPMLSQSFQKIVLLRAPNEAIHLSSPSVRIAVTFAAKIITRQFLKVPVTVKGANNLILKPDSVTIELRGPAPLVNDIDPANVTPSVDAPENAVVGQELPVTIELPDELTVKSLDPLKVKILRIKKT